MRYYGYRKINCSEGISDNGHLLFSGTGNSGKAAGWLAQVDGILI